MIQNSLKRLLHSYTASAILLVSTNWAAADGKLSPAVASTKSCSHYLQSDQIRDYIYKPGMRIEVGGKIKDIFLEKGAWGQPNLIMRIHDETEARDISQTLLREMNALMGSARSLTLDDNRIVAGDLFTGYITGLGAAFLLPEDQGAKALTIALNPNCADRTMETSFFAAMSTLFRIHQNKNHCPTCFMFDMSTIEGRRNWGIAGFYFWNKNLSSDANAGLTLISGGDYSTFLPPLRDAQIQLKEKQVRMMPYLYALNDAIMKDGKIPQAITLYRAIHAQKLNDVWEKLSTGGREVEVTDSAFAFTSFDENFVEIWNRTKLHGEGVILEIHAPAGLPAGYVDRGREKDHAEVILPMNAPLFATQAFTDSKGRKRLRVDYRPFAPSIELAR